MEMEIRKLLEQIRQSPTCYHVIANIRRRLTAEGYTELRESQRWQIVPGGKYYTVRNESSVIAFRLPQQSNGGFAMAAAHSDSPVFKIKEHAEKKGDHYVQLNTERYGGMLLAPWFDRPLSVAGRVFTREDGRLCQHLVNVDRDLLVIPSVAIHMNRTANEGIKYQANIDTLPLYGDAGSAPLMTLVAESAGVAPEAVLGSDLFVYCRDRGTVLGVGGEYIGSPKLDDLECAFGCLEGFLAAKEGKNIPVFCVFDNEEVGSATRQGAASTFLRDTLRRISSAMGQDEEGYQMMLAGSFLVSADNAHARHPNHPEYADADNCPYMNEGVVIKFNAAQKYATDGRSCAVFRSICDEAGVPVQVMANRSDLPGGSTLGTIADTLVPVSTVDIGLPQLAMHSCYETAGSRDYSYLITAMTRYFSADIGE